MKSLCHCGLEVKSTVHVLFHCHNPINLKETLVSDIENIDPGVLNNSAEIIRKIPLREKCPYSGVFSNEGN